MGVESDIRAIQSLPVGEISDWVRRRFPEGSSSQWWLAVFESLETSVSPYRDATSSQRRIDFEVGVEVVRLAVTVGGVRPAIGGYWMLRLASIALRFDPPITGLPEILAPDGSAEWALSQMPLSREQAMVESETRRVEYLAAGDDFYAPVGREFTSGGEVNVKFSALQDVELILSALSWVSPAVTGGAISCEIRAWLEIKNSL
nr:hypothetical protein OG781_15120 [Streptomyces sp. NBC_00830]